MASITGGIKFLEPNFATPELGVTGDSTEPGQNLYNLGRFDNAVDNSLLTKFSSEDVYTTTNVIQARVNFQEPITIDTILILDTNLSQVNLIGFLNGSPIPTANFQWKDFESTSGIFLPTRSASDSKHMFAQLETAVEIDQLFLNLYSPPLNETFDVTKIIVTREIGTLVGYPNLTASFSYNQVRKKAVGGKYFIKSKNKTVRFSLGLRSYTQEEDVNLVDNLFLRNTGFYIYPCGGRLGDEYFKIEQEGWRFNDIYLVQTSRNITARYSRNVFLNGVDKRITFEESLF